MKYYSEVIVTLKDSAKDAQGRVVETILSRMNIDNSSKVNTGKYFSITINAESKESAENKIRTVCEEVFINPILETYKIMRLEEK